MFIIRKIYLPELKELGLWSEGAVTKGWALCRMVDGTEEVVDWYWDRWVAELSKSSYSMK